MYLLQLLFVYLLFSTPILLQSPRYIVRVRFSRFSDKRENITVRAQFMVYTWSSTIHLTFFHTNIQHCTIQYTMGGGLRGNAPEDQHILFFDWKIDTDNWFLFTRNAQATYSREPPIERKQLKKNGNLKQMLLLDNLAIFFNEKSFDGKGRNIIYEHILLYIQL